MAKGTEQQTLESEAAGKREAHRPPHPVPEPATGASTANIIVDRLIAWGVDRIFGVIGEGINPLMEALRQRQQEIHYIGTRHEEAAAFMACGHAKYTGRLGVCISTSGPGAIHLMNGLYDAKFDRAPVLAITGMPPHDLLGTQFIQDVNTVTLMNDVAEFNLAVTGPQHAMTVVDLACRAALSRATVAHLGVSKDVQLRTLDKDQASQKRGHLKGSASWTPPLEVPTEDQLDAAAEILNQASRPMILAGRGALGSTSEVEQLADTLGAPLAMALLGRTLLPHDSPLTTGTIGDLGTMPSKLAAKECDAFLILGSNMPYLDYYPEPGQAQSIQIDRDPTRLGLRYPIDLGLTGDLQATLQALMPRLQRKSNRSFLHQTQERMQQWRATLDQVESRRSTPLKPQFVVAQVSRRLADDAIVSLDTGAHTIFSGRHLRLKPTQQFTLSGTLASMGPALPYAIAAKLAFPGRESVALAGDGGFTMLMGELITARKFNLAIRVVVFRNNSLAQDAWEQEVAGTPEYGAELEPIDFVKFAEACGVEAYRCVQPDDVEPALDRAFAASGPSLVEMHVDPREWPVKPQDVQ
jgi:pyruvate dehydrogenase (quinone)